jgi:hypothetical protein
VVSPPVPSPNAESEPAESEQTGSLPGRGAEDLERLSTEELRRQAFTLAERRMDIRFFWDLVEHLPAAEGIATEDGSAGSIAGGLADVIELVRGLAGHGFGSAEPLLRARFIEYLRG